MISPLDIFDNLNDNFRVILEKTFTVQLSKKNKNKKGSRQVNRKVDITIEQLLWVTRTIVVHRSEAVKKYRKKG